jgi:hypothetical protein
MYGWSSSLLDMWARGRFRQNVTLQVCHDPHKSRDCLPMPAALKIKHEFQANKRSAQGRSKQCEGLPSCTLTSISRLNTWNTPSPPVRSVCSEKKSARTSPRLKRGPQQSERSPFCTPCQFVSGGCAPRPLGSTSQSAPGGRPPQSPPETKGIQCC